MSARTPDRSAAPIASAAPHADGMRHDRWRAADALRAVTALSVPAAWAVAGWPSGAALLLTLGGGMALRFARVPALVDALGQSVLLGSAWAAATGAYEVVPGLDLVAHLASGSVLALLVRALMLQARLLPGDHGCGARRAAVARVVHTASAVVVLGLLWELGEWAGHALVTETIRVGYEDTLTDLVADALGALAAAIAVEAVGRHERGTRR